MKFLVKTDYAHPTSQKSGDIAGTSDDLKFIHYRHPRTDFIVDVQICAMVTALMFKSVPWPLLMAQIWHRFEHQ